MKWIKGIFKDKITVDDALLKRLEEQLLEADMPLKTTQDIVKSVRKIEKTSQSLEEAVQEVVKSHIRAILEPKVGTLELKNTPTIILFCGVNGSGKTTTIGKLIHKYTSQNLKLRIVAADTFRAAAVEQLKAWTKGTNVSFTAPQKDKQDPSSVAYVGIQEAISAGDDVVIIDTAGRLQSNKALMAELGKLHKTISKINPAFPHETIIVLDASIGQNSRQQLKVFLEYLPISGIVVTKLDSTSKCGALISIAQDYNIKIYLAGYGETVDKLEDFNFNKYIENIFK
jgi:fused signal recognition particle receptor